MKISIVQGAYYPVPALLNTGAEKVWYGLGRRFAALGHDIVHVARQYPGLANREHTDGVSYVRIPSRSAPASATLYRLYDIIYSWRARTTLPTNADIVVTNCIWLPIFLRSQRRGRVYVHVARYPKGQMRLYRHASRLQAVSTAVAEAIVHELPAVADRVRVIPPYLTNDPPSLLPGDFVGRSRTVLYVGRLHPEKGIHILVDAFVRVAPPDWKLVVVGSHAASAGGGGEGYLNNLRSSSDARVEFRGAVPQSKLNGVYREAALLVYPSLAERGESFGMVPIEAMSCGCPAIVSDLQCFRDYLSPNVTGWTFDHRCRDAVGALAKQLRHTIEAEEERVRCARLGHAKSVEFLLENVAGRYLGDFSELVSSSS